MRVLELVIEQLLRTNLYANCERLRTKPCSILDKFTKSFVGRPTVRIARNPGLLEIILRTQNVALTETVDTLAIYGPRAHLSVQRRDSE